MLDFKMGPDKLNCTELIGDINSLFYAYSKNVDNKLTVLETVGLIISL